MTPTPETGTAARIRWKDEPGETLGYVGTFDSPAFRIWPPDAEGDRVLLVYLAGAAQHMHHDDSDDSLNALKAMAEELLSEFVSSLGAIFPEPAQLPERPRRRKLTSVDVLDAFRTVTNWSDAEVLHYETCDQCSPEAGLVCDVIAAELAAAYRETAKDATR